MEINFVRNNTGYRYVLDSLIEPIRKHLPESTVSSDNGVRGNLNFVWFLKINVHKPNVFMSHGIGDKNYMVDSTVLIDKFTYIIVSGPAFKEKLVKRNISSGKIFVGGWPKLDPIFAGEYKKTKSTKIRVLYAPTHNAIQAVSSFPAFNEYIKKFPSDMEVINSPHPCRKKDLSPTLQALVDADVVIADAGSMIYEAWSLGKPVIFPDWLVRKGVLNVFRGAFESQIYEKNLGYHAKSFNHLIKLISKVYNEKLHGDVVEFTEKIFPSELRGKSGLAIANILRRLANEL